MKQSSSIRRISMKLYQRYRVKVQEVTLADFVSLMKKPSRIPYYSHANVPAV